MDFDARERQMMSRPAGVFQRSPARASHAAKKFIFLLIRADAQGLEIPAVGAIVLLRKRSPEVARLQGNCCDAERWRIGDGLARKDH